MAKEGKAGRGLLLAGTALGSLFLLSKALAKEKVVVPPPEKAKVSIKIQVIEAETGKVVSNSPATVNEGASYITRATVTNQSTRLGNLVAAEFVVTIEGTAGTLGISFTPASQLLALGAGEALPVDFAFIVPDGTGGMDGQFVVKVIPNVQGADVIALHTEVLTIQTSAIIYKATVSVGVS